MGMFPLLLSNEIEWAKEAVALGAILQASQTAALIYYGVIDPLSKVGFSFLELPTKVTAFLGAASCALVIFSPTMSYLACCMVYGSFYASFLNKVS